MPNKIAQSNVAQIRQETQFTCCAASIASALKAHGKDFSEADVNKVLGASPMHGATWESMLCTVQYFGLRGSLVAPATPRMLKDWTDQGLPILIGWNPEGRPWSHASVVFHVSEEPDGLYVHVMDPNIPNPSQTTRVLHEDDFCQKWYEKMSESLILRRPALVISREVSTDGRQMIAKTTRTASNQTFTRPAPRNPHPEWAEQHPKADALLLGWLAYYGEAHTAKESIKMLSWDKGYEGLQLNDWILVLAKQLNMEHEVVRQHKDGQTTRTEHYPNGRFRASFNLREAHMDKHAAALFAAWGDLIAKGSEPVKEKKDRTKIIVDAPTHRSLAEQQLHELQRGGGAGRHHNRSKAVETGASRKPKHRNRGYDD